MQETIREMDTRQEFWRPAQNQLQASASMQTCAKCGADYVIGSRFCHVCGAGRDEHTHSRSLGFAEKLSGITRVPAMLGLPVASTALFAIGSICSIVAIAVGFIYSAQTLVDWQAVQIWRIEWMLGSVIAFLAALLLKSLGRSSQVN